MWGSKLLKNYTKGELDIIDKDNLKKMLDSFKWSYSRANSYVTCPRMFYITYILKERGESGVFAQYGIFLHEIMELYNNGELSLYELQNYYKEKYNEYVTVDFPPNKYVDLSDSYYNAGLEYFDKFNGYDDTIIKAEEKIDFTISNGKRDINFVGVIDRLSKDENGLIISDYKSKKKFKTKKEENEYYRQLYVYSIPVLEKYGELPYKLKFHFFRDIDRKSERNFNIEDFENAKEWLFNTIDDIYAEENFDPNPDDFFCKYICSVPCTSCGCKGKGVANY